MSQFLKDGIFGMLVVMPFFYKWRASNVEAVQKT